MANGGPIRVSKDFKGVMTVVTIQFEKGAIFRSECVNTCTSASVIRTMNTQVTDVDCALNLVPAYTKDGPLFGLGLPQETISYFLDVKSLFESYVEITFGRLDTQLKQGLSLGNVTVVVEWV